MSGSVIWELQADKVLSFLKQGKRIDERGFNDYRAIEVLKDFAKNAEASSRVRLGETDVVCGVKMVPGQPFPDLPGEGTISVSSELLPLASPEFESGPPGENSIELARVVDRGIRESKAIDFKGLCIREKELAWIVFIDLYPLNFDGNLFDACSIAALSALLGTKTPKLEEDKVVAGEYSGRLKLSSKPLLSTFARIASSVLLDPNLAEEKTMSARFSVATTEEGKLCAFQKGGPGFFTRKEIDEAIEVALEKSKEVRKKL